MLDPIEILSQYKKTIEDDGYIVYAIMLKGSQNYNLTDEESDIDANAIIIPTLAQLRTGITEKYKFETGEVICHDIYSFMDIVVKGNPQFIEVCHTSYQIGGSLEMFKHYIINPSALKGMILEKVNAFDRLYPSREKFVKQFGYDPKQLHHIIRLYDLLVSDKPILEYHDKQREYMMQIKRGTLLSKEEAFALRDKYVEKLNLIYQEKKIKYAEQQKDYTVLDKIVMSYLVKTYK